MDNLHIVVAMDDNRGIGRGNDLPWHLPDDLKHFKVLTSGHCVIMGRRTYESIGRPLPNRRNIVLTRSASFAPEGCEICPSFRELLTWENSGPAFVIGGAAVYQRALPFADRLWVTHVHATLEDIDVFFPHYDLSEWREVRRSAHPIDSRHAFAFDIVCYERRSPGT